jgi:lysine 2,3-aminomutase
MTKPLTSVADLVGAGVVAPERADRLAEVAARYAVAITSELAELINPDDPGDPIARQFVPSQAELAVHAEERIDPIGDDAHAPVEGIVHRHKDRVLLKAVAACPVYCRFCFRRETIGPRRANALTAPQLEAATSYIASHPKIWEVILTGGDPFILSPRRAGEIARRLAGIPHVKIVRWHTRVPLADPPRVSDSFVRAILTDSATTFVALHANHPREFTGEGRAAVARLVDAGIPVVSQSVLLKGVNDDVDTLETLMRAFVELRIKPYYLHHPDLAPGTAHFRISIEEELSLARELRRRVSGLAMPTYVIDIPGGHAKVPLESTNVKRMIDGRYRIRDHEGRWHLYPPSR